MVASYLQTIQFITHTLAGHEPLAKRLRPLLGRLRAVLPFVAARIIVLQTPAWSFCIPNVPTPPWPSTWTTELLRARAHLRRPWKEGHYLGLTISRDAQVLGALELWLPAGIDHTYLPLLDALVPLLAIALQDEGSSSHAVVAPDPTTLRALEEQLDVPLLLVPLAQTVATWATSAWPAPGAAVQLLYMLGDQPVLLLPTPPMSTHGNTLTTTTALARATISRNMALMQRNGNGLECALPLRAAGEIVGAMVVAGHVLRPTDCTLLGAAARMIGPALHRALVYQQLADKEQQLTQILADLPTGLALTDHDGRLLQSNPAWPQLWGVPESVVQRGQLVPWDMFAPLLIRLPDPIAFDHVFRHSDGMVGDATLQLQQPYQLLRIMRIPLRDAMGQQSLTLFVLSDVTREREAERAKTEFVSVVSHELRTPLTSILGYTELLKARDFAPNERFELLDTVWKQANHLSSLVEDLLNVSRIDSGRLSLNPWVLSLRQLVTELITQMNKQLDQQRHHLLLDIPAQLPSVYADRDRLRQILSNLLSNAIKYSPDGGEIVLRAEVLHTPPPEAPPLPPEPALLITVRDPGMGIAPHEQARIFERFYRVDNSNTRRIGGSGLGLAICKALVELHGGRIWVTSQAGAGSTFAFTVPLASDVVHTGGGPAK